MLFIYYRKGFVTMESTAHVKIFKDSNEFCYVGYRGTVKLHDWMVNLSVNGETIKRVVLGGLAGGIAGGVVGGIAGTIAVATNSKTLEGGRSDTGQCVHQGFYDHMKVSYERVNKVLKDNGCEPAQIVISGHSLGGAVATIAAWYGMGNYLYTLGAPRVFCETCPSKLLNNVDSHRFVNGEILIDEEDDDDYKEIYDVVPQTPLVHQKFTHCSTKSYRLLETVIKKKAPETDKKPSRRRRRSKPRPTTTEFTANEIAANKPEMKAGVIVSRITDDIGGFLAIHDVNQYIEALCKVIEAPLMSSEYCKALNVKMDKDTIPFEEKLGKGNGSSSVDDDE